MAAVENRTHSHCFLIPYVIRKKKPYIDAMFPLSIRLTIAKLYLISSYVGSYINYLPATSSAWFKDIR